MYVNVQCEWSPGSVSGEKVVVWVAEIREYREGFVCECCGKRAYCLAPGDGLPTHLSADDIVEIQEDFI